jgi:hypothetical protein
MEEQKSGTCWNEWGIPRSRSFLNPLHCQIRDISRLSLHRFCGSVTQLYLLFACSHLFLALQVPKYAESYLSPTKIWTEIPLVLSPAVGRSVF